MPQSVLESLASGTLTRENVHLFDPFADLIDGQVAPILIVDHRVTLSPDNPTHQPLTGQNRLASQWTPHALQPQSNALGQMSPQQNNLKVSSSEVSASATTSKNSKPSTFSITLAPDSASLLHSSIQKHVENIQQEFLLMRDMEGGFEELEGGGGGDETGMANGVGADKVSKEWGWDGEITRDLLDEVESKILVSYFYNF
jgi:hypothetical protein